MKVLLAMRAKRLPPTAHFEAAPKRIALNGSPFRVLSESEEWTERESGSPRRAAINAFGFGGINAHVLVEEWREQPAEHRGPMVAVPEGGARPDIAIVGLAAWIGIESVLFGLMSRHRGRRPRPGRRA